MLEFLVDGLVHHVVERGLVRTVRTHLLGAVLRLLAHLVLDHGDLLHGEVAGVLLLAVVQVLEEVDLLVSAVRGLRRLLLLFVRNRLHLRRAVEVPLARVAQAGAPRRYEAAVQHVQDVAPAALGRSYVVAILGRVRRDQTQPRLLEVGTRLVVGVQLLRELVLDVRLRAGGVASLARALELADPWRLGEIGRVRG